MPTPLRFPRPAVATAGLLLPAALFSLVALGAGCIEAQDTDTPPIGPPLAVSSSTVTDGACGVASSVALAVTLTGWLDPSLADATDLLDVSDRGGPIFGATDWDVVSRTLHFHPWRPLPLGDELELRLRRDRIVDIYGGTLAEDYVVRFVTDFPVDANGSGDGPGEPPGSGDIAGPGDNAGSGAAGLCAEMGRREEAAAGSGEEPDEWPLDVAPLSWAADVAPIITSACSCHRDEGSTLVRLERDALVGVPARGEPGRLLVDPGNAAASYFMFKLIPDYPDRRGTAMPPPWSTGRALALDELQRIRQWIDSGAGP